MDAVEVWLARLDVGDDVVAALEPMLDEDERQRAQRFRFDHLRRRFVVAHAMMRSVLGVGPDAAFDVGPHGKPSLPGGPQFNLSHSDDVAALAVSPERPVGVDVERLREVGAGVAERIMSPEELAGYRAAADPARFLLEVWTRKEAVVKSSGDGIIRNLRSLSYDDCAVVALDVPAGFLGALAVAGAEPVRVVMREWAPLPDTLAVGRGRAPGPAGRARPAGGQDPAAGA